MENLETLKPVLGEELYTQVAGKLEGAKGILLANVADGSYVPKQKFDSEIAARKQTAQQLAELTRNHDTMTAAMEALKKQLADAEKENAAGKENAVRFDEQSKTFQQKIADLTENLNREKGRLKEAAGLKEQVERLTVQLAEKDHEIAEIHKAGRVLEELRTAGARNPSAVIRIIDMGKIREEESGMTGLAEQLDALRQTDAYLFKNVTPPKGGVDGSSAGARVKAADTLNQQVNDEIRRAAGFTM